MKMIPIILLFSFYFLFADSKDTLNYKPDLDRIENPMSAPLISAIFPGGGHYYLGNDEAGHFYLTARIMLIPGYLLFDQNFSLDSSGNESLEKLGIFLIVVGLVSWPIDVLHAAGSAANYDENFEKKRSGFSYNLSPELQSSGVKFSLNYNF